MKNIPEERKVMVLAKMNGPDRKPVATIAAEGGVRTATLYNLGKRAREEGHPLLDNDDSPEGWTSRDKFNAVLETAALSEAELSESNLCHGFDPEQIRHWHAAWAQANDYIVSRN